MAINFPKFLMKKNHILIILALFLILLSSSRTLWVEIFSTQKQVPIMHGQVDLREWDGDEGEIILLDGDWEFYPYQLLMDGGQQQQFTEHRPKFINVPGKWNESLHSSESTPYGFASYRLQLHVNPEQELNYSIRIPSVRSSSEVYVNGRLLAKSGQVAKTKDEYIAKNLPYSTTFTADEHGQIELVIQVANFVDSRNSGIIRSIKFGSEEAILKELKISFSMQLIPIIIFMVHSVYALILFLLGNREKKLLYFSLLTLSVALTNALSHDEKLFHQVFYMGYDWDFRLANFALILGLLALLGCTEHRELPIWRRIYPIYAVINVGTAILTLFLTSQQVLMFFPIYGILACVALVITIMAIFKKMLKDIKSNLLLLFSLTALIHHTIWSIIWRESGISVVHYPFDLIIATGCFASVWFKDYFNMHAETKELATTLERMNEHKDQFLANTAHEFKNPLHGILNMSQSVLERDRHLLQERSVQELETILTVGRRMSLILNDLLDITSLREGNPRLQKKNIMIQPIITGVLDILRFMVEVKPVKISNQIPEDFPPVCADENRLVQIVFNLLHNAIKYTNEGEITITSTIKDDYAFINITDTGVGMDEDMLQRLFRPYEQAGYNQTMIEGGFGLGLSISKQLVELHGGTLEVSSSLGEGSTFTFSLMLTEGSKGGERLAPRLAEAFTTEMALSTEKEDVEVAAAFEAQEVDRSLASEHNSFSSEHLERPQILIVDDDPINLQVLESMLLPENYALTMVTSSIEALSMLDSKRWDLVIADIMMPQMSGYELTRIIRQRFSMTELPVLLLTARTQPQDIQSGFLAGANDYVTKPVEALELKSRIRALTIIKQMIQGQLQLEAAWLQAQIQPHFLFNTLNSVLALSEFDLEKMRHLLEEFSKFLRSKFQFGQMDELIPLEDELSLVRSYLYIEQVRYAERLKVIWKIDECAQTYIPFLTIQPLVENAVRHGIMTRIDGGTIMIRVTNYDTYTEISVEDDGVGMDELHLQRVLSGKAKVESGVGLINTYQRLKRYYGTGLHIDSKPGLGTKVSFRVTSIPQ